MIDFCHLDPKQFASQIEAIHNRYADGPNCAERVFLAVYDFLGSDIPAEAVAMLSGFGGGIGGTRDNVCGAISGGVAAIGLVHGRRNPPQGSKERAYEVCRDFACQFKTAFGATGCRELIGDLLRESTAEAEERRKARCFQYTLKAVRACVATLAKYGAIYPADTPSRRA
jgi:C_GCAxxG_C_C family probable redox protein